MDKITLSVFLPAWNEEENIEQTIKQTYETLKNLGRISEFEIIIVNDGSLDRTGEICERFTQIEIRVVNHEKNLGYGEALKTGIRNSKYDYVFFTDADGQFDIREIEKLLPYLTDYKVVVGYRVDRQDNWLRKLNALGWNLLNRILLGLKVKDINCAFKIFKNDVLKQLDIRSGGAMISAEILVQIKNLGIQIKEVPVSHYPREKGKATGARPTVILKAFREMFLFFHHYADDLKRQTIYYAFIGALNTVLDFLIYFTLSHLFSVYFLLAKIISFIIGSISSFILNKKFTFKINDKIQLKEIYRFYSVTLLCLATNALSMNLFHKTLMINDLVSFVIATLITFIIGFCLNKYWTFRSKEIK